MSGSRTINVDLPIDVEQGDASLFFVTSPNIRGLLATGKSENEALDKVQRVLIALAEAGRLLDAAPEMLEALKEADRLYSTYGLLAQKEGCGKWINQVRDVIAKATGDIT